MANLRPTWQIEALLTPHAIVAERERQNMANISAELRRLQTTPPKVMAATAKG